MIFKHTLVFLSVFVLSLIAFSLNCRGGDSVVTEEKFRLGNEILLDSIESLTGKRIAVLTNQTGILPDGTHLIDALVNKGANVVKIFSPEHGIRGDENYSSVDEKTGIKIISLYGSKNKPSKSDLNDVDIVIYDLQDVGSRFYTYTSTLYNLIEAAAENNTGVIVCDRPVIINPGYTDGYMLEPGFESFVGLIPAPVCYGLTCGELALYINAAVFNNSAVVDVKKMTGYQRSTDYSLLNLPWVKPSPNMFYPSTAVCYPATCFLEGTNVSEGRGTDKPFEYFGAPWINGGELAGNLNEKYGLKGVVFESAEFTPSEKISNYPPKFFNKKCSGVFIRVTDKMAFQPVKCAVAILTELNRYSSFRFNKDNFIDKLAGTDKLRKQILNGSGFQEITGSWNAELEEYNSVKEKYLLYK